MHAGLSLEVETKGDSFSVRMMRCAVTLGAACNCLPIPYGDHAWNIC